MVTDAQLWTDVDDVARATTAGSSVPDGSEAGCLSGRDLAGLLDGPACRDTLDPMTLRF
jgi:hypothetical protein